MDHLFFYAAAAETVHDPVFGEYGVWILSAGSVLQSAMTVVSETVTSGQSQYVYKQGQVIDGETALGGSTWVFSSGRMSGHVLSGGLTISAGGLVSGLTIATANPNAQAFILYPEAVANNVTVLSNGRFTVAYGAVVSGVNNSGGNYCYVISGGTGLNITTNNGRLAVYAGGYVSGYTLTSTGSRYSCAYSDCRLDDVYLASGVELHASSGATISGITCSQGGSMRVSSGGSVTSAVMNASPIFMIGGYASDVTINSGADLRLSAGATACSLTCNNGALRIKNGVVSGATLSGSQGGIVDDTAAGDIVHVYDADWDVNNNYFLWSAGSKVFHNYHHSRGACLYIDNTTYYDLTVHGGTVNTRSNCFVSNAVASGQLGLSGNCSGFNIVARDLRMTDSAFAASVTVTPELASGIPQAVIDNSALASDVTLSSGGTIFLRYGGSVDGLKVLSGAVVYCSTGNIHGAQCASASSVELIMDTTNVVSMTSPDNPGGFLISGGVLSGISLTRGLTSSGWLLLSSGCSANDIFNEPFGIEISSGAAVTNLVCGSRTGRWGINVMAGGVLSGGTFGSGSWRPTIRGVAYDLFVGDTYFTIQSGGVVSGLVGSGGGGYIEATSGGALYNVHTIPPAAGNKTFSIIVRPGGYISGLLQGTDGGLQVLGGSADNLSVSSGILSLNSGTASEVYVFSRGWARILSGMVASDITVSSGGTFTVSSGGTALAVTSNAGAIITVSDGGYIEYVTP